MSGKSDSKNQPDVSRRDFARGAAIAATAAVLPGELFAAAQSESSARQAPSDAKAVAENRAEIESKVQAIFRRYGDRLTDAQKADIRRLVSEGQKPLDSMRAFPLGNSDQPGDVLKLYPDPAGEDAPSAERRR